MCSSDLLGKINVDLSRQEGNQVGRFFVAFSRVRRYEDIRVLLPTEGDFTKDEHMFVRMFRDMRLRADGRTQPCWADRERKSGV